MKKKKHPFDETMVIIVMVVSALCILIMLASYVTVTGKASSTPTSSGVVNMLNGAVLIEGSGKAICQIKCKDANQVCVLAHLNDKLVKCGAKIQGTYQCLCTNKEIAG